MPLHYDTPTTKLYAAASKKFIIPATGGALFNGADKAAGITLGEGGALATATGAVPASVRGITGKSSGKWIFGIQMVTAGNTTDIGGIGTASATLTTAMNSTAGTVGSELASGNAWVYVNGSLSTTGPGALVLNGIRWFAIDCDNKLFWHMNSAGSANSGNWYGASGAIGNPATGTSGLSFSAITGPFFPMVNIKTANGSYRIVTANAPVLTGYSVWN